MRRRIVAVVLFFILFSQSVVLIPAQGFTIRIWIEKGCGATYHVGEMLKVYWEASHKCDITFYEEEPDGTKRKLNYSPINSGGSGSRGWTIKDYGYGKRVVRAQASSEFGSDSDECEYYVEKEKPPDSDNDGVPDEEDNCNNPGCTIVDSQGCPKDSDNDGLNDCDDQCPSEYGTSAKNGCPVKDSDTDGVPDDEDNCNNPGCTIVDSQGCPEDSDGDGINDCDDQCPTQSGVKSNNGCPTPPPPTATPSTTPTVTPSTPSTRSYSLMLYLLAPAIAVILAIPLLMKKTKKKKSTKRKKPGKRMKTSPGAKTRPYDESTRAYDDTTRSYDDTTRKY